jgi:hypothetical protein
MITPLTVISIETSGSSIQLKAAAPASFTWTTGSQVEIAIPEPSLVPHAVRTTWLASSSSDAFVEWMFVLEDSSFMRHLLQMKQGDLLYIKPTTKQIQLPDHGVWIAVKEAAAIMRGFALKYQTTINDIALIMYQTDKAYFVDMTRVAGQNPSFHIHVANLYEELIAFVALYPKESFHIIAPSGDIAMMKGFMRQQGVSEAKCQFHGI